MPIKSAVSSVGTKYTANSDGTVITDSNGTKYNVEYEGEGGSGEGVDPIARQAIETIETDYLTPKSEPGAQITLHTDYTATHIKFVDTVRYGKIMAMSIDIDNISGANIGTADTAVIGQTTLRPKVRTAAILFDLVSAKTVRFAIETNGEVHIRESNSVQQGNNSIHGSIIMFTE